MNSQFSFPKSGFPDLEASKVYYSIVYEGLILCWALYNMLYLHYLIFFSSQSYVVGSYYPLFTNEEIKT